jgi:hypothetical protein
VRVWYLAILAAIAAITGCGNSGSSDSGGNGTNVMPVTIGAGPAAVSPAQAFASVKVCAPGTSQCQTIDGLLVDTGSTGLRILGSALTLALPAQTDSSGNTIAECEMFSDSFTWGPIEAADVQLGGETAPNASVQVVGAPGFAPPPSGCVASGLPSADALSTLGANGILGVGLGAIDCGPPCASAGSGNPGLYYACTSTGGCTVTAQTEAAQVQNPVFLLPVDNNGLILDLPTVAADGAMSASGSLILGIGTQSNNGLGNVTVYNTDDRGNFTTTFAGHSYPASFIDSGSNGIFFLTSAATGLDDCGGSQTGFYCPSATQSLTATNAGTNGASNPVTFDIANADQLFASGNVVFPDIGGPMPGGFDFGLPFFFGRRVFVAIAGVATPAGPGPYWAY